MAVLVIIMMNFHSAMAGNKPAGCVKSNQATKVNGSCSATAFGSGLPASLMVPPLIT